MDTQFGGGWFDRLRLLHSGAGAAAERDGDSVGLL